MERKKKAAEDDDWGHLEKGDNRRIEDRKKRKQGEEKRKQGEKWDV